MKRQITAAVGPYGNNVDVQYSKVYQLKRALRTAYDTLEDMDDNTFNACDGEALIDDLDIALREVDSVLRFVRGEE